MTDPSYQPATIAFDEGFAILKFRAWRNGLEMNRRYTEILS